MAAMFPGEGTAIPQEADFAQWGEAARKLQQMWLDFHRQHAVPQMPLPLKRLLQLATLDGAVDLNIADRTGSITPGKRADLVLLRASDTNMAPAGDPYEAVVSFASPANVETVIVDGRILRRAGKFTAADEREIVGEARQAAIALREKAKWPG